MNIKKINASWESATKQKKYDSCDVFIKIKIDLLSSVLTRSLHVEEYEGLEIRNCKVS